MFSTHTTSKIPKNNDITCVSPYGTTIGELGSCIKTPF